MFSDFKLIPKKDTCNHLSSGMRYSSFSQWAGFYVPNYSETSEKSAGSKEDYAIRSEFLTYTHERIACSQDMISLFKIAISESADDNVKELNGTINVDYVSKCKNAAEFLDIIKTSFEQFSSTLTIHPFLGLDSDQDSNIPLANMLLESGIFKGIELSGKGFANNPEKFLSIFKMARKMNIESKIGCLGFRDFKDRNSIFEILQNLNPSVIINPNIAVMKEYLEVFKDGKIRPEVVDFLKDKGIKCEFSSAPYLSGIYGQEKNQAIREFAENGLNFSLCTEDLLYLNKSLSEFAADLYNQGVFSREEIVSIISE